MIKNIFIGIVSTVLFGTSNANAGFAVVNNAPVFEGVGFYSDGFDSKGTYNFASSGAQIFGLEETTTVGSLTWWGSMNGFYGQNLGNVDCFQVVVWNADFSKIVYAKRIDIADIAISTTGQTSFYGQDVYEFVVTEQDLGNVTLAPDSYFMNIGAILNDGSGDQFVWSQGQDVDGFWYTDATDWGAWKPLPNQIDNTAGGAFSMIAAIPSPGAIALIGLAGIIGNNRRR